MVKILYYMEPMIEADYPYMKYVNITTQLSHHIKVLSEHFDVSIMCSDHIKKRLNRENFICNKIYSMCSEKLTKLFPNSISYNKKIRDMSFEEHERELLCKMIVDALPEKYSPDVIITFLSYSNILQKLFPNSKVLHMEYGIFSREPYPKTYHMDPHGILRDAYTNMIDSDKLSPLKEDEINLVNAVKALKERLPKLPEKYVGVVTKYKHNVLLPLQFSNYHAFDLCCDFDSQFSYLRQVINDLPEDVGIIVTQHPGWSDVITKKTEGYLREYKNVIFNKDLNSIKNVSQILLSYVDGVITVSSSIGLQTMLYDKPIFIYGNSHLSFLSEDNMELFLDKVYKKSDVNRDKVLSHLMQYYYIPDEFLKSSKFIKNYIYHFLNESTVLPSIETPKYLANFYNSKSFALF